MWTYVFILVAQSVKNPPAVQKPGSIPGLEGFAGRGNGNPLQYSCLGNPMDRGRGAWWVIVHGVTRVRHDSAAKPLTKPSPCIRNGITGSYVLYLSFWATSKLFFKVAVPFCISTAVFEISNFSRSSPIFLTLSLFFFFFCGGRGGHATQHVGS